VRFIAPEPFRFDETAAERRGRLLVLTGKGVFPHLPTQLLECFERLALGMQRLALAPPENTAAERCAVFVLLIFFRNRREPHHLPVFLAEHMANQVVLVEPLLDNDDRGCALVVLAAEQRVVVPIIGALTQDFRQGVRRLQAIVDDNQVGSPPGEHAPDRASKPVSASRGDELLSRGSLR
jgi:hypothetical protein